MPNNTHAPGPRDWSFGLSIAKRLRNQPLEFVRELAETYGDIASFRLGPYRTYFINYPDLIHDVLVTKGKSFRKFPQQTRVFRNVDGEGLIISEGDFWLRQRRMIQPALHPKQLHRYGQVVIDSAQRLAESWKDGGVYDFNVETKRLALAVIGKSMFGADIESDEACEIGRAIEELSAVLFREFTQFVLLPDWLPLPKKIRKRRALKTLDDIVNRIIADRRTSGEDKGDLLSKLLAAVDVEGDGTGMTNKQVRDEVMTLFNAGHDTTAASFTWVFYVLAKYPDVQSRVREEMEQVANDRPIQYDDLPRLQFTERVINETLRMYPPTWGLFARQAIHPVALGEYEVPRGGLVMIYPFATHRDGRFFENPESFDPERWSAERVESIPRNAFLPFGAGPHVCVGKAFSMMELKLGIATILKDVRVRLATDRTEVELASLVALRPKDGLRLKVERLG